MSVNPYRFASRPAAGLDFVDRPALVRRVTEVWEEPGRPGNLSIIGNLRTGKTSLMLHALRLMERTDLTVARINVVIHGSAFDFFRSIAEQLTDLPDLAAVVDSVRAARDWYDLSNAVTALFKEVGRHHQYVLLVLDEFDRAPFVLADLSAFQLLRSLASEPEYPVGLITVSRRAVIDIETDAAGGSRLDGVLGTRCYVGMFTAGEAAELIGRARPVVDLSGVAAEITDMVGRHPYLLSALCARIVDRYLETGAVDVADAYELQRADFGDYYDRLLYDIDADSDGSGRTALIEIARGADPMSDSMEAQNLIATGVVEQGADRVTLFSREFGRYLLTRRVPALSAKKPDRGVALIVATEWDSRHGGLSTLNRQLCLGLADQEVRVFCMVLDATDREVAEAGEAGVTLLRRKPVAGAPDEHRLFRRPELPDGVVPTLVIGHGRVTGPAALVQGEDYFPRSTKLHFIHMAPDEIEFLKLDRDDDVAEAAEIRTRIELQLGRSADRVVAVGPRLHGRFLGYFTGHDDHEPLLFNPGFDLLDPRPRKVPAGTPMAVLTLGRMEDAHLKGLDIAARACGQVASWRHDQRLRPIELVVRGTPAGSGGRMQAQLTKWAGNTNLTVVPRMYTPEAERLTEDLQRSSLFLMPSRAEGFGLVGLEAIVAGTPVLISEKSGLGELLIDLLGAERAAPWVVPMVGDTGRDAETWARSVERVLLDSVAAFAKAEELRLELSKRLTRAGAVETLLEKIHAD
ncbi:glycosyltransferase [Micromonospora sp. NPDC047187]|uniref:glycosyltransferase n=1 Tax=Micromonospora sp. NPDC047187 TaxID=3155262 RepID=UPI0033EE5AC8